MERYFSDSPVEIVSFPGTPVNNDVVSKDCDISTVPIENHNEESQCIEQLHVEVQTEEHSVEKSTEYNELALLDFLRRCAPVVESELRKQNKHFGANFQQSLIEEDEIPSKKIETLPKHANITSTLSCLQISWSAYGNKIAVSYGNKKHESWCKHTSFILIYETDKNEEFTKEAKLFLEIETCVVAMRFHPKMNSILVFATDEGKIYWHCTSESLESNSKNYFHHQGAKITQMSWIEIDSCLYLVVSDTDGFLYFWTTSSCINDWNLRKKVNFKSLNDVYERGILCFDFSSVNSKNFVVALEGIKLLQCSTNLMFATVEGFSKPVVREFECPCLVITRICFSKFEDNIFAVSGSDEFLRIYYLNEKTAVFTIATNCIPMGIEWSHLQDNIIILWSQNEKLLFYDFRKSALIKTLNLERNINAADLKVRGMKLIIAAVDVNNEVTLWQSSLFVK